MKNLKKTIALLSAFVMAGTMLAGCNGSTGKDSGKTEETTKAADGEETRAELFL